MNFRIHLMYFQYCTFFNFLKQTGFKFLLKINLINSKVLHLAFFTCLQDNFSLFYNKLFQYYVMLKSFLGIKNIQLILMLKSFNTYFELKNIKIFTDAIKTQSL